MGGEPSRVAQRERSYEQFWQRRRAQIFHQTDGEAPHVDLYRYAPTWRLWAPARQFHVYVTGGMADRPMPVGPEGEPLRFKHVELCAYTRAVREAQPGRDATAWALHTLAHLPWREGISFMPLETVSWGGPLLDGSAMTAFFFVLSPDDDRDALTHAAGADRVLQVMTITDAEHRLAQTEGSIPLLDRFEAAGVPPLVDWNRASCVARAP